MMSGILSVGQKFPEFSLPAVVSLERGKEFSQVTQENLKGKWTVLFFYPLDFTFVCPTELVEFGNSIKAFQDRETQLFAASGDSHFSHLAWRQQHPDLKNLPYPMLADYKKDLSEQLGILHPADKVPLRATFIIDPDGIIRWVNVNDLNVGRNVKETLRVIDALQTDELCPCNWEKGQKTL